MSALGVQRRALGGAQQPPAGALDRACPICGTPGYEDFYELSGLPVQDGLLWPTREAALAAPVGDVILAFCRMCGYVGNRTFDPSKLTYDARYDISLHFSPLYVRFIDDLASRLIIRYDLHGRTVIEVGCGKGDFLRAICRRGGNRGIGFDPTFVAGDPDDAALGITFIRDVYSEWHGTYDGDLVCCRHVLESVPDPLGFVRSVRRTLGTHETTVYFEVPNAGRIFGESVIWNVTYESGSYFGAASLRHLFATARFEVLSLDPCFQGEYLGIEARPAAGPISSPPERSDELGQLASDIQEFARNRHDIEARWRVQLAELEQLGLRCAAWGAGGRAITFLTTFGITDLIPMVVDVNPNRQGAFLPGTGQPVVAPSALLEYQPDVVVVTNPAFGEEIGAMARALGLSSRLLLL